MNNINVNFFDSLFPNKTVFRGLPRKTVISGSTNGVRTELAKRIVDRVIAHKYPVIIIHRANAGFSSAYSSVDCGFDPTAGLTISEIATLFFEAGKTIAGFTAESRIIISIGLELMVELSIDVTFNSICTFPWETITKFVFLNDGFSDAYKLKIIQRIEPFSMQIPAVAAFFSELCVHAIGNCSVLCNSTGERQGFPHSGSIALVDIGTDVNTTLTELILSSLKLHKENGHKFMAVLDSLPIPDDKSISFQIHKSTDTQTPLIIMSPDIAQSLAVRSNVFNDVVGSGVNAIVFSHSSGNSAEVWSNYFGEYYYVRQDTNIGKTKENYTLFKGTKQESITEVEERRRYVLPEEIMQLEPTVAYAKYGASLNNGKAFELVMLRKE